MYRNFGLFIINKLLLRRENCLTIILPFINNVTCAILASFSEEHSIPFETLWGSQHRLISRHKNQEQTRTQTMATITETRTLTTATNQSKTLGIIWYMDYDVVTLLSC